MSKKDKHSKTDDAALFRSAIGAVRPVKNRRSDTRPPPPKPRARFREADERAVLSESLAQDPAIAEVETGEELSFARNGVSRDIQRKLRRGKYAVQDEIDLHGLTVAEAREALGNFMTHALARRARCVRVVHGKGHRSGRRGPVLKNAVNRWLRQWDAVVAFCSAPPNDGGTGAVYVLLSSKYK